MKLWNKRNACLMLAMCLTACNPSSSKPNESGEESQSQTEEAVDLFYIYCNDSATEELLQSFLVENPEYKNAIAIVGMEEDNYELLLEEGFKDAQGELYPDLVVLSKELKDFYMEQDVLAPVNKFGIKEKNLKGMYDYMLEYGTNEEGTLKALSWMDAACVYVYRTSLAEQYLNVTTPDEMEDAIRTWIAFADTASLLASKSDDTVRIVPELDTIKDMLYHGNPDSWYPEDSEDYVIGDFLMDGLMMYQKLASDLTWNKAVGTEEWYAALTDGSTLGFFGNSYFVEAVLGNQCGETAGDWAVCQAPTSYETEGVWIAGTESCKDAKLAGELMTYLTTNTATLESAAMMHHVAVNNVEIMEALAMEDAAHGQALSQGAMSVYAFAQGSFVEEKERVWNTMFWEEAELYWEEKLNIEQFLEHVEQKMEEIK